MTNKKKSLVAEKKTLKAYEIFKKDIYKYFETRKFEFEKSELIKLEKIQDKLYFKSLKKDRLLERALKDKVENELMYKNLLNNYKLQNEDLKLSIEKYKSNMENLKLKYNNGQKFEENYKIQIKKIQDAHNEFRTKITSKYKSYENKQKIYKIKFIKVEEKWKESSLQNLEKKKHLILKSNAEHINKLHLRKSNLRKSADVKINLLKKQFNEKVLGIHSFNNKKNKVEENHQKHVDKIQRNIINYKPIVLTKEILKTKSNRWLNENMDSKFFPDIAKEVGKIINKNKIIFIILLLLFYTSMLNSNFWSIETLKITMKNNSEVIIMGLAMTMVIITGGIDLSVGSVMAFSAVVMMTLARDGTNVWVSLFVGLLVSGAIGFGQGLLIGYARMVPFVVTLAGLMAFRGLSILHANSQPVVLTGYAKEQIRNLNELDILGLNLQIWIVIICLIIFLFVLKFTVFGRHVYAIGSNRRAAFLSGVKDKKVETIVYTISGIMAGLGGFMMSMRSQSIQPSAGNGWELKAIAAVVIGGTSLRGGKGGVMGTFVGWIILAMLPTVFTTLGYNVQIEKVATGLVIIVAIFFNNNLDFKGGFKAAGERWKSLFKQYFVRRKL